MAKMKVPVKQFDNNSPQIVFNAEMESIRKALSVIEEQQKKSALERRKIMDLAKKASTVERLDSMRRKNREKRKRQVTSGFITMEG